ncbi:uncharacterized protein [Drosophila virilis]|uniref:uncharacterized protein n=1 Tax=Drosophila virilis TaxID=7244 RepID=UPI0038B318F6
MFTTVIDKDPYLTNIEKLQHLRSCLKRTALDTIRSLQMSNANYAVALELIDKRFNNNRLIFQAHIAEILGLRKVDNGATTQLREFSVKVNSHLRAFKSMGSVKQIAGCIIVHTLLQKLDSATQASWEDDAPLDVIPSCERLTALIEKRCQRLENVDHATAMYTPGSQVGQDNSSRRTFVVTKNGTYACVFCEAAGHSIYKRLQFAKLSPSLRLHEAKRLALCLNCLQRGHQLRVCGSSTCRVCGSKHHSLLHIGNRSSHSFASSSHNVQESETYTSSQNILAVTSSSTLSIDQHLKHDVVLLATAVINQIDTLIGASLFFDLLCVGQIKLVAGLLILQTTRFGWVVTGGAPHAGKSSLVARRLVMNPDLLVDSHLQTNAQIDELSRRSVTAGHTFRPTSEYSVRLPLRLSLDQLGDSYQQALRRFLNLERKLDRNPTLKTQYAAFIKEYPDLNHMSLVSLAALGQCYQYYLPHHCVLKVDSTTIKLRVVFDGPAGTTSGHSLNDALMAGPTIHPKLFSILMRFRTFAVALTGDICKMYRCVRVEPADSYLQCILWRDSQHQKMQTYKLDTVTYGTKPASFLSVRAMHQLAMDEQKAFPIGADIIKRDFYVDDLILGGSCVQEAVEILKQTSGLLAKGYFKLRKWRFGDATVLQDIPV